MVDSPGGNLLAQFTSAVNAVQSAVTIQKELSARNAELPENRRMYFRIGVNLGDVIIDGVNVAARVESLAEGGGTCVSGPVYDQVVNKLSCTFDNLGEHTVKNIAEPVRVYEVRWDAKKNSTRKAKPSRQWGLRAVAVSVVTAIAFIVWGQDYEESKPLSQTEKPSIAVLPFLDLSPEKDQEYFSDGMAEEILNALVQVEGLRVAARSSYFMFKGDVNIPKIGEQLNVSAVLEGSVRKEGDTLRITAQLNNVDDGLNLWSKTFERELKNVFVIQDEISKAITKALQVELIGKAGAPLVKPHTENFEAYDHYLQGRYHWNQRTDEGMLTAIDHFEQAIALDPNYALAYSGLADALNAMRWRFPEDFMTHDARIAFNEGYTAKRNQALEKALALDLDLAEAHTLLGFIKRNNYDLRGAEKEFRLAIDLKPEYATTHHWYSVLLAWTGRFDEALMEGKRALEMDPMHHVYNSALALLLQMAGQDDAAIHQFQRTLTLHPERPGIQWHLNRMGVLYLKTERIEEAVDAFGRWSEQNAIAIDEETLRLFCKNVIEYRRTGKPMPLPPELKANPITGACFLEFIYVGTTKGDYIFNYYHNTEPTPGIFLAHLYAIMGQREKALESLEQAQNELGWLFTNIALLYAMLGEKEKAFEFIEEGYGESLYGDRDMMLLHLKVIPAFDPIRSEPRFIAFMRKVGLEEE